MVKETMTSEERLMAAISLEKPDRVPIAINLDTAPAARLLGLNSWEVVSQGFGPQLDVVLQVFDEYGGWDGVGGLLPPDLFPVSGMRAKPPSEGSPENQVLEGEVWTTEEYDLLVEVGWQRFVNEQRVFRVSDMTKAEEIAELGSEWMGFLVRFVEEAITNVLKHANAHTVEIATEPETRGTPAAVPTRSTRPSAPGNGL